MVQENLSKKTTSQSGLKYKVVFYVKQILSLQNESTDVFLVRLRSWFSIKMLS